MMTIQVRKIFVICTSGAKYCQVFPYAPYISMEWFCTQCVAIYRIPLITRFNLNMI